jgi:CubicO group peptidase (beta-lactamase class C family)
MFTATAVMILLQEGRVSLDAPASDYIPELAAAHGLTVRMLLTHTSGLHTYTDAAFDREDRYPHTSKQMIDYIAAQKPLLDFPPGSAYRYSNSNFYVAGVIVERVSGMPLQAFLQLNVFAAAGLTSSALDHERDVVPGRASGYLPVKSAPRTYENAEFISMDPPGGAGGLRSTAIELARFHQALFAGRIVSSASLRAMTTPARLSDGTVVIRGDAPLAQTKPSYGFGLELAPFDGEPTVGHGGAVPGFAAYLVSFPRLDLTVAIMTNSDPTPNEPFKDVERAALALAR